MAKDIFGTLDDLASGIGHLRDQLAGLHGLFGGAAKAGRKTRRKAKRAAKKATQKARKAVSAKVKAMRKLQGRYMGYVRKLSAAQKAQVKKVRESKGYQAAISMAKGMGK